MFMMLPETLIYDRKKEDEILVAKKERVDILKKKTFSA